MANRCYNRVEFTANPQSLDQINNIFNEMFVNQFKETLQLPPFLLSATGHFFDIYPNDGKISYSALGTPNTDILLQIADRFQADFVHEYAEASLTIYGESYYENGVLTSIGIDHSDLMLMEHDENGNFKFEEFSYESVVDVLDIIMERKRNEREKLRGYSR